MPGFYLEESCNQGLDYRGKTADPSAMAGRNPVGGVWSIRYGLEDFSPGEENDGNVVERDRAFIQEEYEISQTYQQYRDQNLLRLMEAGKAPCDQRGEQNYDQTIQTVDGAVDDGTIFTMNSAEVQRHQITPHHIDCLIETSADHKQEEHFVFFQNGKQAGIISGCLICGFFRIILDRSDVIDLQLNQYRGAGNGDAADQKGKPQVIAEQKSADRRRQDQTKIAAEIKQRICPLTVFRICEIGNQSIVAWLLHALKDCGSDDQTYYSHR